MHNKQSIKRKILFSSYFLGLGGIETALITLLKEIHEKYDITLVLEKKEGIFLDELPKDIKIIVYKPSENKNIIIRKFINYIKQLQFKIKYKNKFDFSACYATYSYSASFVARNASTNSALWVHNDYMSFYDNNLEEYKKFFHNLKVSNFNKIVFVSRHDKKIFLENFDYLKSKCFFCNNLIDYKKILKKADEEVNDIEISPNTITFINIGRHDEKQKKLSRIIEAVKMLNSDGYVFDFWFVGDGVDNDKYQEQAKNIKNIKFLGSKKNPYPYLKKANCLVMSSDFEGYPVVVVESLILGKDIISTEVSDSKKDIEGKYGLIANKSSEGIYFAMKKYLNEVFLHNEFNPEEFNELILDKLDRIIDC